MRFESLSPRWTSKPAGIVDPVKVVRSVLQNAASIANMVLSTEVVIVEKPEKKSAMPSGGEDYDY